MDLSRSTLGVIGAAIAVFGSAYYIYTIIYGSTRPSRVSWGVWLIIGILGAGSITQAKGGTASYVPWVYVGCEAVVFGLSLTKKYGKPGGKWYDYPLGAVALLAVLIWQIANLPASFAATVAIFADAIVLWPTLRESWYQPHTESLLAWSLGVVDTGLAIAALAYYSYSSSAFLIYVFIGNSVVTTVLLIRQVQDVKGPVTTTRSRPFA